MIPEGEKFVKVLSAALLLAAALFFLGRFLGPPGTVVLFLLAWFLIRGKVFRRDEDDPADWWKKGGREP